MEKCKVEHHKKSIAIIGLDGSGKTTQVNLLYNYLLTKKYDTSIIKMGKLAPLHMREIINYLSKHDMQISHDQIEIVAMALAMKKQLVRDTQPVTMEKEIVIYDRYIESCYLFAHMLELHSEFVDELLGEYWNRVDLIISISISPETCYQRILSRQTFPNNFETYESLCKAYEYYTHMKQNSNIIFVNGEQSVKDVHDAICNAVSAIIE